MGSIGRMDPKVVGTCPCHHSQPIGRNRVFEMGRPEPPIPPLIYVTFEGTG